jgi:hypothetical protein
LPKKTLEVSAPPAIEASPVAIGPAMASLSEEEKLAMRAIVREELQAALAGFQRPDAGGADERPPEHEAPTLTQQQLKDYDQARVAIDNGLRAGRWTEDDRDRFRQLTSSLPFDAQMEIVTPLIVARNQGRLRFEGHGPVF